jgi:hypothetical protein
MSQLGLRTSLKTELLVFALLLPNSYFLIPTSFDAFHFRPLGIGSEFWDPQSDSFG